MVNLNEEYLTRLRAINMSYNMSVELYKKDPESKIDIKHYLNDVGFLLILLGGKKESS